MSRCECFFDARTGAVAFRCEECSSRQRRLLARKINNGCRTPRTPVGVHKLRQRRNV